jgi:hypothetical protein
LASDEKFFTEKDGYWLSRTFGTSLSKTTVGNDNILAAYPDGRSDYYALQIQDAFGGPQKSEVVPKKRAWQFSHLN